MIVFYLNFFLLVYNMKVLFVVAALLAWASAETRESPCPEQFKYIKESAGSWVGELNVKPEYTLHGIWIRVLFDTPVKSVTTVSIIYVLLKLTCRLYKLVIDKKNETRSMNTKECLSQYNKVDTYYTDGHIHWVYTLSRGLFAWSFCMEATANTRQYYVILGRWRSIFQ